MLRLEPVRRHDRERVISVLLGRAAPARQVRALLDALGGPQGQQYLLWCARGLRGVRAAAMGHLGGGRTATVFHSRPRRDRDVRVVSRLLEALTGAILQAGCVYVQALIPPEQRYSAEACAGAGYEYLTQLVYLRLPAAAAPAGSGEDEVLAGHRASGVYTPSGWLLPHKGDECVGCVLINDSVESSRDVDVVYLGVRPPWRRRGFARAMIARAADYAASRQRRWVTLAVDAANTPAVNLYRQVGFTETCRRDVWAQRRGQRGRKDGI